MNSVPGLARDRVIVAGRIGWIVVRLLLVYWLLKQGSYFYYQGF